MTKNAHTKAQRHKGLWLHKALHWAELGVYVIVNLAAIPVMLAGKLAQLLCDGWCERLLVRRNHLRKSAKSADLFQP